jgi:hypothetical protein
MSVTTIPNVIELLQEDASSPQKLPAVIEELNLAVFDVSHHITLLQARAGRIEEDATAEASSESNADKRKVRRCELLRDDADYQALQLDIHEAERLRVMLQERSHRYAREHRQHIAEHYSRAF